MYFVWSSLGSFFSCTCVFGLFLRLANLLLRLFMSAFLRVRTMKNLFDADQRLVILRALNEAAGYSANCSMLSCVLATYGHNISRDRVRAHMRFLEDVGLLTIDVVGDKTLVARITEQGADVATGRKSVDGVKRPAPGGN